MTMAAIASVYPSPLAGPINDFSLSAFRGISIGDPGRNAFLSPFGITTALAMLMLGSRSTTEQQLRHGLHFDSLDSTGPNDVHHLFQKLMSSRYKQDPSLLLSNYVLLPKSPDKKTAEIMSDYGSRLKSFYSAEMDDVDFAADGSKIVHQVNKWVDQKTHGMIKQILTSSPDPMTSLMILNAIYFKGKWKSPFDKELTHTDTFHNSDGKTVMTDFMSKREQRLPYQSTKLAGSSVHVVELPYAENNISMLVVIPEERHALDRLIKSDSFEKDVKSIISSTAETRSRTKIDFFLPKFKLETEYDMNPILHKMGITDVFTEQADLSGINGQRTLHASAVKHKAVVRVDEEGTEAAAVTSVMVRMLSYSPDVRADHPFLFIIVDRVSGIILFVGKVERL